jgi:Ran GTPase-activating protein (RanGAP) involved in mRNA processing and transport
MDLYRESDFFDRVLLPILSGRDEINVHAHFLTTYEIGCLCEGIRLNARLSSIRINGHIEETGVRKLAAVLLRRNIHLRTLNLDHNDMGELGAKVLAAALRGNRSLTKLSISFNRIGDAGVRPFAGSVHLNTSLTTLVLWSNRIGDDGARYLASALARSKSLTSLDLSSNQIGDEGALALAAALGANDTMENLCLYENHIAEGGTALAVAVERSRSMTQLNIKRNPISPQVMRRVHSAPLVALGYRQLIAFAGALIPGREKSGTLAEAFVRRDGDFSLGHRIAWFLLKGD